MASSLQHRAAVINALEEGFFWTRSALMGGVLSRPFAEIRHGRLFSAHPRLLPALQLL